jgi:hypothetical protein
MATLKAIYIHLAILYAFFLRRHSSGSNLKFTSMKKQKVIACVERISPKRESTQQSRKLAVITQNLHVTAYLEEERIVGELARGRAGDRIIPENLPEKRDPRLAEQRGLLANHCEVRILPLRERLLKVREIVECRPLLRGRRAHDLENLEDGVDLRVAREERLSRRHLRQDAPA